jgi:glucose/mannose transport system substrate-binding protein
MVITGKAASQIMGDWAQGEFAVAGQVAGKDYDCLPGLGINPVLDTGGDSFFFPVPKGDDAAEVVKAQLAMASMLMSKEVQVDFNLKKGSLPVRGDIDMSAANDCMQKGIKILEKPENILPSSEQVWSPDTQGQFEDLWVEFFSSPEMKVADAQARFVNIIKTAD